MSTPAPTPISSRVLRFHEFGEPADVLRLEDAIVPLPDANRVRVRVHACGLNPADWALCRGLFPGGLPRGIGLDVSGIVDAVGEGVTNVHIGDPVLGVADYAGCPSAGAADYAILNEWVPIPPGLDLNHAAALPMAIETAFRSIDSLGVTADHTLLVHGGGTMMGFAAVQIARLRGARVITTAGQTFADQLRAFGAQVTPYGPGMVETVRDLAGGSPDLILDTSAPNGVLPDLIEIAGGDPKRVLTITDFTADNHGVRTSLTEGMTLRYDALAPFTQLAADGKFTIPIAQTFPLTDWREALQISQSGHAHGKLLLLP